MSKIDSEQIRDDSIVEEVELKSSGLAGLPFLNPITILSTVNSTKIVTVQLPNGNTLKYARVAPDDILVISSGTAVGTYTIVEVLSDTTLSVAEAILDSTSGSASLFYKDGSKIVGFDPTNLPAYNIADKTVYDALARLSSEPPSPNGGGPMSFSSQGTLNGGDALYFGRISTSEVGLPIVGVNQLSSANVALGDVLTAGKTAKFNLVNRIGVNTFVIIPNTLFTVPEGSYKLKTIFDPPITLPTDPEIGVWLDPTSDLVKSAIALLNLKFLGYS